MSNQDQVRAFAGLRADRDAWKRKYEAAAAQHVTEIAAAETMGSTTMEFSIRKTLWLSHHSSTMPLYGDDGEMQCGICLIDFKRDELGDIARQLVKVSFLRGGVRGNRP